MAHVDERIFLWINGLAGRVPLLDRIVEWVVSDYLVPASLALTLIGIWFVGSDRVTREKHQVGVFVALTSMALSSFTVLLINAIYSRPRPFVDHDVTMLFYYPTDPSFPSNAAAATFGIAFAVWGVNRLVGTFALLASVLYAFVRVFAGVHYPLDVVAGALIGAVVAFFVFKLREPLKPATTLVIEAARVLCLA